MGNRQSGNQRHRKAWAPYNFVPMPDEPIYADLDSDGNLPRHDAYDLERHTGYYDIKLVTETPLFVRGMLSISDQENGIESRLNANAFSIDGRKPVIPGSSLRGMIRTLVEIVTNSKMHFVSSSHKMFFRAVAAQNTDPLKQPYQRVIGSFGKNVRAGYLERDEGTWYVHPAKRIGRATYGKVKDRNHDGSSPVSEVKGLKRFNDADYIIQYHPVCFDARDDLVVRAYTPSEGEAPMGVLVCSGNMLETQGKAKGQSVKSPRRRYAVVSERDNTARRIPISSQAISDYLEGLSPIQKEPPFDKDYGVLVHGRPIFYVEESGQIIHFGHTPNFRIAALHVENGKQRAVTPQDLVPRQLRQNDSNIDYAEAMFGFVNEQGDKRSPTAYAGRIAVTSAFVTEDQNHYYDETFVPKILASPKPTTFQHYLEQPEGWRTPTDQLLHYGDKPRIRGHKLYWRQMIQSLREVAEPDRTITPHNSTQHTVIAPVRSDVEFNFRIYFENLSDEELGALHWVLTFGGNQEARHQLGMGKPFGLGVVRLEPKLFLSNRRLRYEKLFSADGSWQRNDDQADAQFVTNVVDRFKRRVGNFDEQKRIRELLTLVQKQEVRRFAYMKIEPRNDYAQRPVLPKPSEVD